MKISRAPLFWVYAGMASYVVLFSCLSIAHLESLRFCFNDLAIFNQSLWNTIHGGGFLYNSLEGYCTLGYHASYNLFLILPFYYLFPYPHTLLVLQTIAIAAGALPVFLIAREKFAGRTAMIFSFLYLLYHPLQGINYDNFHPIALGIAPFLFSYYFFMKRKFTLFWVFVVLALSCREDAQLIGVFYGIYMAAAGIGEWKRDRKDARETPFLNAAFLNGAALVLFSGILFYVSVFVVMPHFLNGWKVPHFEIFFPNLGGSPEEMARKLLFDPIGVIAMLFRDFKLKAFYVLEMLLPLALFPLMGIGELLIALPDWGYKLLSLHPPFYTVGNHYPSMLVPFIFISAITGMKALIGRGMNERKLIIIPLALTILFSLAFNPTPLRAGFRIPRVGAHQAVIKRIAAHLPKDAPVATQSSLYPIVSNRRDAFVGFRETVPYVLLDTQNRKIMEDDKWDAALPKLRDSCLYEIVEEEDGVVLFKKR